MVLSSSSRRLRTHALISFIPPGNAGKMPTYFANGLSSSIGGSSGLSGSIFSFSHLRPWAEQWNVAVLGDDGGGRGLVGGAAVIVIVGEALGEEAAEFPAEGGAVDCREETHPVDVLGVDGPVPSLHCMLLAGTRQLV